MAPRIYTIKDRSITGKSMGRLCERLEMRGLYMDGNPVDIYEYTTGELITQIRKGPRGKWECWTELEDKEDYSRSACWRAVMMPKHEPRLKEVIG